jgi:hypothetical protein
MHIHDGKGGGYAAEIDKTNRMQTWSVSEDESLEANKQGRAFNVNTGWITLTDAVDTPILYIKNNETTNMIIDALAIGIGPSTGGTGIGPKVTIIRNPTTGTIITSTPTDVDISSNRNYGSTRSLNADAYKGATGDTMTDGEDHILVLASAGARAFLTISEVLPLGASIGVKIQPPTSNTSMEVYVAAILHVTEERR